MSLDIIKNNTFTTKGWKLNNSHQIWIYLITVFFKIYERPCEINTSKLPLISLKRLPQLVITIYFCILLFSIAVLNDYHSTSTYSSHGVIYHMNMWGCGWRHIRVVYTTINIQICLWKIGIEGTYVYSYHTCTYCSLLSCVWGIISSYSIIHVLHPQGLTKSDLQ